VPFRELTAGLGEDFSISKLTGYLLMLAAITRPRICLSRPPGAFWWFALYLLSYGLLTIPLEEKYQALAIGRIFSFAQLLVLFWISHNLLYHEQVLDGFLGALVAGTATLAALLLTGIGATEDFSEGVPRVTVLGENWNELGMCFVMGLLCLIGLFARRGRKGLFSLQALLLMYGLVGAVLCLLATALLLTGSRAAVLSLVCGLMMMIIMEGKTLRAKIRSGLVVLSVLGILLGLKACSSDLGSAFYRGHLLEGSKEELRDKLYREAWAMFLESPMQGAGPVRYTYQLSDWTGYTQYNAFGRQEIPAHNLALAVLAETGLIGFTPYFLGLISCTAVAWKYRRAHRMALPLALLFALLVYNVTHTWDYHKLHWIVLALATVRGEPPVGSATGLRPTSRGEIPHGPRT